MCKCESAKSEANGRQESEKSGAGQLIVNPNMSNS